MTDFAQLVPGRLGFADPAPPHAPYPGGWLGVADVVEGPTRWLHVGGVTDAGARRLALVADRTNVAGRLGVGTPAPEGPLHVADAGAALRFGDEAGAAVLRVESASPPAGPAALHLGVGAQGWQAARRGGRRGRPPRLRRPAAGPGGASAPPRPPPAHLRRAA